MRVRRQSRDSSVRQRNTVVSQKDENEIFDLFELSPMSVTKIADSYNVCRLTVYRIAWKKNDVYDAIKRTRS